MKKICLTLMVVIAAFQFSYGQWQQYLTSGNYYLPSGNAAIGTTPLSTTKLTVAGGGYNVTFTGLGGQAGAISFEGYGGTNGTKIGFPISTAFISNYGGSNEILALNAPNNHEFLIGNTEKMRLTSTGLGIGTTSPGAKLSLVSTSSQIPLNFQAGSGGVWAVGQNVAGGNDDTFSIYSYTFGPAHGYNALIKFDASNGNTTLNPSGGNVGIGTTPLTTYKLAVNGAVIATSMKVKLNTYWPDYVFSRSYILPTLRAVKTYINKNKHLPEMPSAKEVAKNGLDLGEIDQAMTKKIEELTLYLIEQKKQLDKQNELIAQQRLINEKLQRQINKLANKINK